MAFFSSLAALDWADRMGSCRFKRKTRVALESVRREFCKAFLQEAGLYQNSRATRQGEEAGGRQQVAGGATRLNFV